jgi:hypothetical protein
VSNREGIRATLVARASRLWRGNAAWFVYVVTALACVTYLNLRADLVPRWGEWYAADEHPFVLMQVRAFLSGRLALARHPSGAVHDTDWGRGGIHTNFGLGEPILAVPLHIVARLFGAPGFPDDLRFLIFYGLTALVLARALHRASSGEAGALVASAAAAGFVMVFPTFVGLVSARFLIYEQAIATGAMWNVLLLSGVVLLVHRCTPARFVAVCGAAGFSMLIRPPLAVYGVTTVAVAAVLGRQSGIRRSTLLAGLTSYAGVTALYFAGNALRFGSPWNTGYANIVSVTSVNRLTRWGLSFANVPFTAGVKELFVMMFQLDPISSEADAWRTPHSLEPYVAGERWREYYSPTFDVVVFAIWIAALGIVAAKLVGRVRRGPRVGAPELVTIVGVWALPPSIALFIFYARLDYIVTRYLTDLYPAFAAAALCVGMAIVGAVRRRAPDKIASTRLAITAAVALYLAGGRGWVAHLSRPVDRKTIAARIAGMETLSADMPVVDDHFSCNAPRGKEPVHNHLAEWQSNCSFNSGMVFAMRHRPCVSFTFGAATGVWGPADDEALAGFRAKGDFDSLVRCGAPSIEQGVRRLTMCDPHPPPFLLDGLRLYSVASLDAKLNPIDRLRLLRIDGVGSCP